MFTQAQRDQLAQSTQHYRRQLAERQNDFRQGTIVRPPKKPTAAFKIHEPAGPVMLVEDGNVTFLASSDKYQVSSRFMMFCESIDGEDLVADVRVISFGEDDQGFRYVIASVNSIAYFDERTQQPGAWLSKDILELIPREEETA